MGRKVQDLPPEDEKGALDAIAGYAVSIDMTARDVQDEAKRKSIPWTAAKGFDTFLPISKYIPKSAIPDPHDVELWLTVNGRDRQRDSTALMLFRIPRILSEISRVMKLEEGDIVLTGTPKGVGSATGQYLKPGDLVEASIGGIGVLSNPVVASEDRLR